jgi:hypothetical protein
LITQLLNLVMRPLQPITGLVVLALASLDIAEVSEALTEYITDAGQGNTPCLTKAAGGVEAEMSSDSISVDSLPGMAH